MADEQKPNESAGGDAKNGGGSPMKAILIVGVVVLLEAATIGVTMMFAGGPSTAEAGGLEADEQAKLNAPVELLLVKDRYPNLRSGRHFLYDTEIFITVRSRDAEKVKTDLEAQKAQITKAVAVIIRRAEPSYFQEPTLATLSGQIKTMLDERFGKDEDDEPIIRDLIITRCIPYRADF